MNGIVLLLPEWIAKVSFGLVFIINGIIFLKHILPVYSYSFMNEKKIIKIKMKDVIIEIYYLRSMYGSN